ncbi:MAG: hypothetical protein OWS74_03470 [Firmicutes bacterium]|nr:hypothetical protein [Bacillota bacterium]
MMQQLAASAKINIGLAVGPVHAGGYHFIDTVFHSIALADRLKWQDAAAFSLTCSDPALACDASNLVVRAVKMVEEIVHQPVKRAGHLIKQIPAGAGLGGGSADAAAVLRWAILTWPQYAGALRDQAVYLGKDVPFLIEGGARRAQGSEEKLQPLASLDGWHVLLLNPGLALATPAVYQAFDALDVKHPARQWYGHSVMDEISLALNRHEVPAFLPNALEPAAFMVQPALQDFKEWVQSIIAPLPCHLSGSGATYYALSPDKDEIAFFLRACQDNKVPWSRMERMEQDKIDEIR